MPQTSLFHRIRSFAVPQLISTAISFAFLPVLARSVTRGEWVALAVGQSVGSVAAIAINFGWTLSGPAAVAALRDDLRRDVYLKSLRTQLAAWAVAAPLSVIITWYIAPPGHRGVAALMNVACGLAGLAPTWFNIGTGAARSVITFDVLPRVAAVLAALVAISAGFPVWVYPLLLGIASLAAVVSFVGFLARRQGARSRSLGPVRADLRRQIPSAFAEIAGGSYSAASLALVASQATLAATTEYTSGARIYQMSLLAVLVVSQSFQGWVTQRGANQAHRLRKALLVHIALGLLGLLGIGGLGHLITRILFGDHLAISPGVALAFGFAFLGVSANTAMGRHLLIVRGKSRIVMSSTLAGAVVGVPTTLLLAHLFGAAGGAWALAISEVVVCGWQLPASLRIVRTLETGGW